MDVDVGRTFACLCGEHWHTTLVLIDPVTRKIVATSVTARCRRCGNEIVVTPGDAG